MVQSVVGRIGQRGRQRPQGPLLSKAGFSAALERILRQEANINEFINKLSVVVTFCCTKVTHGRVYWHLQFQYDRHGSRQAGRQGTGEVPESSHCELRDNTQKGWGWGA